MKIWQKTPTLEELNSINPNTIHEALGICFTKIGDDFLEGTMPVNEKTLRVYGVLHGGASVVLAESLGSTGSALVVGPSVKLCVGIEINASHLQRAYSGFVTGRATPIRLGRTLHVWDIRIREGDALDAKTICQSRLTVMVQSG